MENIKAVLTSVKDICEPVLRDLPDSLGGTDYHNELAGRVKKLDENLKLGLRKALHRFLICMEEIEASDIDMGGAGCSGKIWYRVFGHKKPLKHDYSLALQETDVLLYSVLTENQSRRFIEKKSIDFSYSIEKQSPDDPERRYRASLYMDLEHAALNMRRIDTEIRPFKNLGVHPEIARALSLKYYKYGLSLVTGITGSGKSSTLDTIIDANNRTSDAHIVVIASPVELIHKPIRSVVRHREVGRDVTSFKNGAVEALRQDPDIIVIGELRDPETIMTALEITDSGHKTFGTLHTSSAMESIERILGEVKTEEQDRVRNRLADVLTCVISQKLVASLDGRRVLAKEVLLVTPSVRAAIRNNNVNEIYQMLSEGSALGMNTMEQDLKRLYEDGKISKEEAYSNANNKKRLQQLLNEFDS